MVLSTRRRRVLLPESSAAPEVVRPIDALAKRVSWRSDDFRTNATRNRRELSTCDLRLGTQQAGAAHLEGRVFRRQGALCFLS